MFTLLSVSSISAISFCSSSKQISVVMCVICQSFLLFLNSQESSLLFLREDTVTINEEV